MRVEPFPFFSGSLYARKVCNVYLPPGYAEAEDKRYPVIYLLHGLYGSEAHWLLRGNAEATLDTLIEDGRLRESIVVMPSDGGYGPGTFYVNWYDGSGRFEDYFLYDLIPAIDSQYRTLATPQRRALCGLSMGGYGAVILALRHPGLFAAAASISGALLSLPHLTKQLLQSEVSRMIGPAHGPYAQELDPFVLAGRRAAEATRPALHFNCGLSDELYGANQAFKSLLEQIGYPHEYMEFAGEHNWDYFAAHLPEALAFIERSFAAYGGE